MESIKRDLRVHVISLDTDITLSSLPDWMRQRWISTITTRLSTLRRSFLKIVEDVVIKPVLFGNKTRIEQVDKAFLEHLSLGHPAPNVFFYSGAESIGRFTTAKGFIDSKFENGRFSNGPVIPLGDPASIEEFYMQLVEDVNGPLGANYGKELSLFRSLDIEKQVMKTIDFIEAIYGSNETVYLDCSSGTFDENGDFIDWSRHLIREGASRSRFRLVIISNRQPRFREVVAFPNLFHFHVNALKDDDVDALVRTATLREIGQVLTPTQQARAAIGGHPLTARYYAQALSKYGDLLEEKAVHEVILAQRAMFADFLAYDKLADAERDLLSLLSWVPEIGAEMLSDLCNAIPIHDYETVLERLFLASLVEFRGGKYSISGPVRLVFRQLYGDGNSSVGLRVAELLGKGLETEDDLSHELIDIATYTLLLFAGDFPLEAKELLSPSTILRATRALYRSARDSLGPKNYARVIALCQAGLSMTKEDQLRRDITAVQARSFMRMKLFSEANSLIETLEQAGGRLSLNLRAQYHRFQGNYKPAVPLYRSLVDSGITDDAVLHEYCLCLRKVGDFSEVTKIISRFEKQVDRNIYLLATKASLEMGANRFRDAENTISKMQDLPDNRETAAEREAVLLSRESQNYEGALDILNEAIERVNKRSATVVPDLYSSRCLIFCKLHKPDEAKSDAAVVKSRHREGDFVSDRLNIAILLAEKKPQEALARFERLIVKTRLDASLKKR